MDEPYPARCLILYCIMFLKQPVKMYLSLISAQIIWLDDEKCFDNEDLMIKIGLYYLLKYIITGASVYEQYTEEKVKRYKTIRSK